MPFVILNLVPLPLRRHCLRGLNRRICLWSTVPDRCFLVISRTERCCPFILWVYFCFHVQGTAMVDIISVRESDAGRYTCVADNGRDRASDVLELVGKFCQVVKCCYMRGIVSIPVHWSVSNYQRRDFWITFSCSLIPSNITEAQPGKRFEFHSCCSISSHRLFVFIWCLFSCLVPVDVWRYCFIDVILLLLWHIVRMQFLQ